MTHWSPDKKVRSGVFLVMEGRGVVQDMTITENLRLGAYTRPGADIAAEIATVYNYFPRLRERTGLAGYLSGGEQQMLAIGRALMARPKLILMDEPSMGLSPLLVKEVFSIIRRLNTELGISILLVEQNANMALKVADYGYIMETGKVVMDGDAQKLPVADAVLHHVLLLDVLEHLPDPDACIAGLHRSLKPGGTLVLQVPFMYPVHDAPLDFHRWTRDALAAAAARHGFSVSREVALGHPLETAALISNIALSATVLRWIRQPNPLAIVIVLLPFIVLARNTAAWLMASISPADGLMPYAYRMTWTKG